MTQWGIGMMRCCNSSCPYNKQQPNSGQLPHRASAPPLRCRSTSPCRCCLAERLPLKLYTIHIGFSSVRVVHDDLDESHQRRRISWPPERSADHSSAARWIGGPRSTNPPAPALSEPPSTSYWRYPYWRYPYKPRTVAILIPMLPNAHKPRTGAILISINLALALSLYLNPKP